MQNAGFTLEELDGAARRIRGDKAGGAVRSTAILPPPEGTSAVGPLVDKHRRTQPATPLNRVLELGQAGFGVAGKRVPFSNPMATRATRQGLPLLP
jgi:hypothetical protein